MIGTLWHWLMARGLPRGPRPVEIRLGAWLAAALDDPSTCEEMKADIFEWMVWTETRIEPPDTTCPKVPWRRGHVPPFPVSAPAPRSTEHKRGCR